MDVTKLQKLAQYQVKNNSAKAATTIAAIAAIEEYGNFVEIFGIKPNQVQILANLKANLDSLKEAGFLEQAESLSKSLKDQLMHTLKLDVVQEPDLILQSLKEMYLLVKGETEEAKSEGKDFKYSRKQIDSKNPMAYIKKLCLQILSTAVKHYKKAKEDYSKAKELERRVDEPAFSGSVTTVFDSIKEDMDPYIKSKVTQYLFKDGTLSSDASDFLRSHSSSFGTLELNRMIASVRDFKASDGNDAEDQEPDAESNGSVCPTCNAPMEEESSFERISPKKKKIARNWEYEISIGAPWAVIDDDKSTDDQILEALKEIRSAFDILPDDLKEDLRIELDEFDKAINKFMVGDGFDIDDLLNELNENVMPAIYDFADATSIWIDTTSVLDSDINPADEDRLMEQSTGGL